MTRYDSATKLDLANAEMTASLPFINTGQEYIGWINPEIWVGMERTLHEYEVLTRQVEVQEVYTLQFLQDIYGQESKDTK